jgi:hypothetical protein
MDARIFEFKKNFLHQNTNTFERKATSTVSRAHSIRHPITSLPSNLMVRKTFQFRTLNGKVGLFIVDFVGNGSSACSDSKMVPNFDFQGDGGWKSAVHSK